MKTQTLRKGTLYRIPDTSTAEIVAIIGTVYEKFLYFGTKEGAKKKRDELQAKHSIAVFIRKVG